MKLKIKVKSNRITIDAGDNKNILEIYKKLENSDLSPSYLSLLTKKSYTSLNGHTGFKHSWYSGIIFRQTKYPDRKLKKIREALNIM